MQVMQYICKLKANLEYVVHLQPPTAPLQVVLQCLTFNELHHQEPVRSLLKVIINIGNAWMTWMVQTCQPQCLCLKKLSEVLEVRCRHTTCWTHHLHRYRAIQSGILRFVNRAHTAAA